MGTTVALLEAVNIVRFRDLSARIEHRVRHEAICHILYNVVIELSGGKIRVGLVPGDFPRHLDDLIRDFGVAVCVGILLVQRGFPVIFANLVRVHIEVLLMVGKGERELDEQIIR